MRKKHDNLCSCFCIFRIIKSVCKAGLLPGALEAPCSVEATVCPLVCASLIENLFGNNSPSKYNTN